MKTFTKTSFINCSLEELFDFHMNVKNIKKITPNNIKVELLDFDISKYECKIINIRTTKYFLSTHWKVRIDKTQKPNLLVDVAVQSPFKSWKHEHIFTQKGNVCELKDVITYEMPFGFFGKLIEPFIEYDITNMFDYRHKQTKLLLESK